MRAIRSVVTSCLMGSLLAACGGAEPSEGGVEAPETALEASSQELVNGTWTDHSNGNVPADGMNVNGLYVCAALDQNVWNPGKLHLGQCHYGWGGAERRAYTYRVLSRRSTYTWVSNTGATPANAVAGPTSGGTQFAVCTTSVSGGWAHGKVYLGQCHYGWGGSERRTTSFWFLVDQA